MKIAVAKEIDPSESRVAASPDTVKKFKALGVVVCDVADTDAFFVNVDNLAFEVHVQSDDLNLGVNAGFLAAHVVNGAFDLDAFEALLADLPP